MATGNLNPTPLMRNARDELSFRKRIVELLGGMLSPKNDVPPACRAMVVLLLFLCLSASCVLGTLVLALVASIFNRQPVNTELYAALLTGHGLLGAAVGFPVTIRMTRLEEAKQLQSRLTQVQKSKIARGQKRAGN